MATKQRSNRSLLTALLPALIVSVLGIVLILKPDLVGSKDLSYIIGGCIIALGAVLLFIYFYSDWKKNKKSPNFVIALMAIAFGVYLVVKPEFLKGILYLLIGLYLVYKGASLVRSSLVANAAKKKLWFISLIVGIVLIVFAALLMYEIFVSGALGINDKTQIMVAGICLLVSGLYDIGIILFKK